MFFCDDTLEGLGTIKVYYYNQVLKVELSKTIDKAMRVIVVSAEGPGNFHVLLEKHLPFEEHLQDFLKEEAKDASIPDNIEINQICLAQHPQNKNWYRAKVLRSNYERRCHEVMLIDYGNVIVVNELRIRRLDNKLLKEMPPLASKCCLENYKHFETNISTVNQRFQFLVSER